MSGEFQEKYINSVYSEEGIYVNSLQNNNEPRNTNEYDIRLILAHPDVKKLYHVLTNKLNKYTFLSKKETNEFDNYYFKKKELLKIRPYFNKILIMFNFNNRFCLKNKIELENVTEDKYPNTKYYLAIDDISLFDNLFDKLLLRFKLNKPKYNKFIIDKEEIDYLSKYQKTSQEILCLLNYSNFLDKSTSVNSQVFPDSLALNALVLVKKGSKKKGKLAKITVGELSAGFMGNYDINLDLLKKVDMAPEEAGMLSIVPMGECKFSLNVWADEYDVRSLKMILITKGNVYKYYN